MRIKTKASVKPRARAQRSADELEQLKQIIQQIVRKVPGYPYQFALVARLSGLLEKRMSEVLNEALKPLEMTAVLYHVLMIIHGSERDGATPTVIADLTGEKPNNVTHICNQLELKGHVTRMSAPDDRRRVQVALTGLGRRVLSQAQPLVWRAWQVRFKGFTPKDVAGLPASLTRQLLNLDSIGDADAE